MGELVTAATVLVGSGAGGWLVDKLLGPSFDALGEHFRAYAGDRLGKVFGRAESKVDKERLSPLPAAFALEFTRKASSSEEDETITEMWASLLAAASVEYHSRHMLYVDILSQLSPAEAKLVAQAGTEVAAEGGAVLDFLDHHFSVEIGKIEFQQAIRARDRGASLARGIAGKIELPGAVIKHVGFSRDGGQTLDFAMENPKFEELSFQILQRQNLMQLDEVSATPVGFGPTFQVKAKIAKLTLLGLHFYSTCEAK